MTTAGSGNAKLSVAVDASDFLPERRDGLEAPRAAARDCRRCDLWRPTTQTVFGDGSQDRSGVAFDALADAAWR